MDTILKTQKRTSWNKGLKTYSTIGTFSKGHIPNLAVSCQSCNCRKRDKTEEEYRNDINKTKVGE